MVVGSLVLALRAAQTEGGRPVDETEVVEFARTTLVDLLSYTPDDTRRVESALARLCPDSPEAGSARGLVEAAPAVGRHLGGPGFLGRPGRRTDTGR